PLGFASSSHTTTPSLSTLSLHDALPISADEDFDRTYLDQQVLAHEETTSLMRSYSEKGDNPQLRSVALATLPVVERHLEHMKGLDRKSTRLNSSHVKISYAVFCLKKKNL